MQHEYLGELANLIPPDTGSPGEPCTDLANAGRVFDCAPSAIVGQTEGFE